MHAILNICMRETEFLLDDKISEEIHRSSSKDGLILKLNVLRKILAIKNPLEMKKFFHYLESEARISDDEAEDGVFSQDEQFEEGQEERPVIIFFY